MDIIDAIFGDEDEETTTEPAPVVDEAEIDRRIWSSKSAVQSAADAAYCCRGRDPHEVVADAKHTGEYAAAEVWALYLAYGSLPGAAKAHDAYSQVCAGNTELSHAANAASQESTEMHYAAAQASFASALRTLGW